MDDPPPAAAALQGPPSRPRPPVASSRDVTNVDRIGRSQRPESVQDAPPPQTHEETQKRVSQKMTRWPLCPLGCETHLLLAPPCSPLPGKGTFQSQSLHLPILSIRVSSTYRRLYLLSRSQARPPAGQTDAYKLPPGGAR